MVGISVPPAGSTPKGKPTPAPRTQGQKERRRSERESVTPPSGNTSGAPPRWRQAMCSASPTANSPTATSTTLTPSSSSGTPKVRRGWPVCRSMPTSPSASPKPSEARPRSAEPPSTAETVTKHSTISAKYSAGPSSSAYSTTMGPRKAMPAVPTTPATKEPMAAVASAGPERPLRAMRAPSSAVMTLPDSPGALSRMLVVEPPYIAP